MRRWKLPGGLVAALAVGLASASAAVAAPAGLAPIHVRGATFVGPTRGGTVSFVVALAPRDRSGLDSLLAAQRSGHAGPLTPAQYDSRFSPRRATIAAIRRWAGHNGLHLRSVSADRQLVELSGSPAAVARAFGTHLVTYRESNGQTFRTPATSARLPASFSRQTISVVGLSNLGRVSLSGLPHLGASLLPQLDLPSASHLAAAPSLNYPASYGPSDFWQLYHAPARSTTTGQSGHGQNVAVIAEGDLSVPQSDFTKFEQQYLGGDKVTWNTIKVNGASSDTSGNDEWDLDTQYSVGFAPDVSNVDVYDGPSLSDSDILATVTAWVNDTTHGNSQANFSAGECELLAYASGFSASLDSELAHADSIGKTLFSSSGDTGSFCPAIVGVNGVPAGLLDVNYPAASPYAIGVGGTTVLGPGPNEIAWYAGGGGASFLEPAPSWQSSAGGSFLGATRGVPDVALDADPNSGYNVIVAGQTEVIGGTSASSPSWEGIWARAQASHGGTLGFAGPVIYGAGTRSAYHDITLGSNGLYPATPGWDYDTGLGTPDITAFLNGS